MSEVRRGAVFSALADPTRRAMIATMANGGETTPTELAARFPMSRQAVSKHLSALTEAGLVIGRRDGRELKVRFEPRPLDDAVAWMTKVSNQWDRRLAALQARATSRAARPSD